MFHSFMKIELIKVISHRWFGARGRTTLNGTGNLSSGVHFTCDVLSLGIFPQSDGTVRVFIVKNGNKRSSLTLC